MKKQLIIGMFVTSALFLVACSDKEQSGTTEKENNQKETQVEEKENVLVFEVDGEKKEEKLVAASVQEKIAEKVYLPVGFEERQVDENRFEASGTGKYEGVLFFVQNRPSLSSLEMELYNFKKEELTFGGPGSELHPFDLNNFPELKEKYDHVTNVVHGNDGTVKYLAIKMGENETATYVIVTIKNDDMKSNHEDFALELLEKVHLPEPA